MIDAQPPVPKRNGRAKPVGIGFLLAIILLAGFIGGYWTANREKGLVNPLYALQALTRLTPNAPAVYDAVLKQIQQQYVLQPVDNAKLFYGAVSGLVRSLGDPYSTFFTPEAATAFKNDLDLSIEGIGAEIGYKEKRPAIIAPLPSSPAEKIGLKAGDFLLTVDERDVTALTIDEIVGYIRGKAGTKVTITVVRTAKELSFTVQRERITIASVTTRRLKDNIALVQVVSFNEETLPKFDTIVRGLLLDKPKGIILDLRNNPGGLLDVSVDLTGEFIGKQVVVKERDAAGKERSDSADRDARLPLTPLVVLVNGGSASASEIVAGALQDSKRATIVGTKTFGKGSVQTLEPLPDGSQLKLTIAKWFTPLGRTIDGSGITPDVVVEDPTQAGDDNDIQLQRALKLLTEKP
ncbi:MAG: S41 family peptidase [Patescibacteria group bacterium]